MSSEELPRGRKGFAWRHQRWLWLMSFPKATLSEGGHPWTCPPVWLSTAQAISVFLGLMRSTRRINRSASTRVVSCIFKELKILNNEPKEPCSQIPIRLILQMSNRILEKQDRGNEESLALSHTTTRLFPLTFVIKLLSRNRITPSFLALTLGYKQIF